MTMTAPSSEVQQAIAGRLVELGWTDARGPWGPGIATKEVVTAVGEKRALALWQKWPECWLLVATYDSCGNNAIIAPFMRINAGTSVEEAVRHVDAFNATACEQIDATYARRLHLNSAATAMRSEHAETADAADHPPRAGSPRDGAARSGP
jgi:hypothetical protein